MDTRRSPTWWECGLIGGIVLSVMTLINAIAAIPRFFSEAVPWAELVTLPFAVFAMGFVCGCLVGMLRDLSRWLGCVGDALIGTLVMVVFFLCCMLYFDRNMLLGRSPGRNGMLLLGAVTGLLGGIWIGHDLKRAAESQTVLRSSAPSPPKPPAERGRLASRYAPMIALEITMPIASDWPTREELAARNAVEEALISARVGKCTGAGGGMGQMHLTYRVDDESAVLAARAVIDEAMKTYMPNFEYQIQVHKES